MFDLTIHLGDVLVATGFLVGGYRMATTIRDDMRGLKQTVFGSKEPPVQGLVDRVDRLEKVVVRQ